jgi:hypothetical protein
VKRASLALLFAASAASFAATVPAAPAWAFVALAAAALLREPIRVGAALASAAENVLRFVLLATLLFGWIVMVYPVLSTGQMRLVSLLLGYPIGALGALFLLSDSPRPSWTTTIPAAAAMLVISGLDLEATIHPYLWVAGLAGLWHLALDLPRTRAPRRLARAASVAAFGLGCGVVGSGIAFLLPWTQERLEEVMLDFFTPLPGGDERNRSQLGELQSLKLSKKIVLRVWSERPQRLRSRVLVRFDGREWFRDNPTLAVLDASSSPAGIETAARSFLADIPGSDFVPDPGSLKGQRLIRTRVVRADGEGLATPGGSRLVRAPLASAFFDAAGLVVAPPDSAVRIYGVLHDVNHQRSWDETANPISIAASLQLPENLDPRIPALSEELARGASSRKEAVERIVASLRDRYRYSLDVSDIDASDPIPDFLFRTKQGWCEYFAASAVVLLRARGIPARYVQGFNVIGSQKKGDHYVVREWDRHAWVEVYHEGEGWLEYDPTPPSEYESLHAGLGDSFWEDALEAVSSGIASFYARFREWDWSSRARGILGAAALLAALYVGARVSPLLWRRARARRKGDEERGSEIEELARELDGKLERLGHRRPRSRAPLEHLSTLPDAKLPPGLRDVAIRILDSYYRARFGGRTPSSDDVRRLEDELARLR